jgi:hypothetical protein
MKYKFNRNFILFFSFITLTSFLWPSHQYIFASEVSLNKTQSNGGNRPTTLPDESPINGGAALVKNAQRYIALPQMSEKEVRDLIEDVVFELVLNHDFKRVPIQLADDLSPPEDVVTFKLATSRVGGSLNSVYFGYMLRPRRSPQLWVYSVTQAGTAIKSNIVATDKILDKVIPNIFNKGQEFKSKLALKDLSAKVINLSYVDADGALYALKAMGYSVITDDAKISEHEAFKGKFELKPGSNNQAADINSTGLPATPNTAVPGDSNQPDGGGNTGAMGGGMGGMGGGMGGMGGGMGGMGGFGMGGGTSAPQTNSMKYPTIKNLPNAIDYRRLPLIIKMPTADEYSTGLVGAPPPSAAGMGGMGGYGGMGFGGGMGGYGGMGTAPALTSATAGANAATPPLATPVTQGGAFQLMVLFDPSDIDQLNRVQKSINDLVDKPAKQIFVEGLVIEINSDELSKLGVQWSNTTAQTGLVLGALSPITTAAAGTASLLNVNSTGQAVQRFTATLSALVASGKAEVISRPSVLTLDNRQAVIKVGTDNPIASSISSSTGSSSTNFTYQSVGISLNVRPRVSEDNSEISMLVDASVTSIVPGGQVNVTDSNGVVLATAPTINNRKIQTYARVGDSNPLIIGGLVNTVKTLQKTGVPYLSSIPYLGRLFSYQSPTSSKTEVIIVITPTIVSENPRVAKINYPKDSELFNHRDDKLFRDGYRLTAGDLIPLNTLYANQQFIDYKKFANSLLQTDPQIAKKSPFMEWTGTNVPGEEIYVRRALMHITSRLELANPIPLDNFITLQSSGVLGFKKISLGDILREYSSSSSSDPEKFFTNNPKKALVISYDLSKDSEGYIDIKKESIPFVSLVDCADSDESVDLLWKLNQPDVNGNRSKFSFVIKDPQDLNLLKASNIANLIITINGGPEALKLTKYSQGRLLQVPLIAINQERTITASMANNFFYYKLYLQAFKQNYDLEIEKFKLARNSLVK